MFRNLWKLLIDLDIGGQRHIKSLKIPGLLWEPWGDLSTIQKCSLYGERSVKSKLSCQLPITYSILRTHSSEDSRPLSSLLSIHFSLWNLDQGQASWHLPLVPELRRTKQEELATYEVLGQPGLHEVKLCFKKQNKTKLGSPQEVPETSSSNAYHFLRFGPDLAAQSHTCSQVGKHRAERGRNGGWRLYIAVFREWFLKFSTDG